MKVRYIGQSFGIEGLTNGKVYECLAVESGFLRIVDDSGEDYLYSSTEPASLEEPDKNGKWEVVHDDEKGTLKSILN